MKRIVTSALLVVSAAMGSMALAQDPVMDPSAPGAPMDGSVGATGIPGDPAAAGAGADFYRGTGWDPSLIVLAGGALTAGSLAMKGRLRKRA